MNKLSLWLLLSLSSPIFADTIWVERESYHTALLLPAAVVVAYAPALQTVIGNQPYIRFGWGNQDYYGASQKSIGKAMKALFIPSASVVEIAGFAEPTQAGATVVALDVSKEEIQQLLGFISTTFKFDSEHKPILVRTEPTGFRYYSAMGRYHLFRNCNNWTAEGLKRSGKDVYFRWSFLAGQVMGQLP
ncbi:MAG: DUF2459 domain-containing protein [Agitococcus sp.]|nr:DUF2459 domain-containing protein [Agitococcus sp.]